MLQRNILRLSIKIDYKEDHDQNTPYLFQKEAYGIIRAFQESFHVLRYDPDEF